ncbi:hypothetical protein BDO18943_05437 [Burkholderia dolosa]|nr:hypothetical protein BDO18943_05437 [Burkholderia dolosa]
MRFTSSIVGPVGAAGVCADCGSRNGLDASGDDSSGDEPFADVGEPGVSVGVPAALDGNGVSSSGWPPDGLSSGDCAFTCDLSCEA